MSVFISNMLEDRGKEALEEEIPLNIAASTELISLEAFNLVVGYCTIIDFVSEGRTRVKPVQHNTDLNGLFSEDHTQEQKEFFEALNPTQLNELLEAANFLDIPKLFDACCAYTAYILMQCLEKEKQDK